jgi:hypothetical protein
MRKFYIDFIDRGASKNTIRIKIPDILSGFSVVLLSILGLINSIKDSFISLLGVSGNILPTLFFIVAGCISYNAIVEKNEVKSALSETHVFYQYKYNQFIRIASKAGILISLIFIPIEMKKFVTELIPLPKTISGYLVDKRTSKPIAEATVRIKTTSGVDITEGTWISDTKGFYIVKTMVNAKRDSKLDVSLQCNKSYELPLSEEYEIKNTKSKSPTFKHVINGCDE